MVLPTSLLQNNEEIRCGQVKKPQERFDQSVQDSFESKLRLKKNFKKEKLRKKEN